MEQRSLARLARMAFVPPGDGVLPRAQRAGVDISLPAPLLVDRFEVTRAEWLEWLRERPDGAELSAEEFRARWRSEGDSFPATWMTCDEAARFAQDAGLRLLSASEWMRVAAGTRAQRYPWGAAARSVANTLELGLEHLAPVGTFENGRTTLGIYDLIGNASEWVEGTLLELDATALAGRTWAAGGSYLDRTRPLFALDEAQPGGLRYNAVLLDRAHRGRAIGLRVCAPAGEFLRRHAPRWSTDPTTRSELRAIGRRWGSAAVPLLEALVAEPGAAPALSELLAGARR